MISKKDKQAILNGAYGITRNGSKVKYAGESDDTDYPFTVLRYNNENQIISYIIVDEDFKSQKGTENNLDVIGLWGN